MHPALDRAVLEAAVFDLDGVITFTARVHAATWKELFDAYLRSREARFGEPFRPFDADADYRTYVDGRPRYDGVRTFLASRGITIPAGEPTDPPERETISGLGNRKNVFFRERLRRSGVDVDHDAVRFVRELRAGGVRVGIASSSKNAAMVLDRAGLTDLFDARVDGVLSERLGLGGKPRPDIFLECLKLLGAADASRALVAEDAIAGVEAGRAGGFGLVLGVDRGGEWVALREHGADWIIRGFREISLDQVARYLEGRPYAKPNALARWADLDRELADRRVATFVDAGVLAPAPDCPEPARFLEGVRGALREVADVCPTTIVGDRARADALALGEIGPLRYAARPPLDACRPDGARPGIVALYIGDDSDEDAFRALIECGIGVRVATIPKPTTARYSLQNAAEVRELLGRVAVRERKEGG